MLDITFVIVSYNTCAYLRNCLSSLYSNPPARSWEVIVIDNGSSDGSISMVEALFPHVTMIANGRNIGYARANNQGAGVSRGRYLLFLNPDTVLLEPVDALVEFMDSHRDCGALGGKVLNPDGTPQSACRSFPSLRLLPFGRESPLTRLMPANRWSEKLLCKSMDFERLNLVDAVGGVFMMVRKEVFDQIGGFNEEYFLYVEDIDLCYRIKKSGWKIHYCPWSSVVHFGGRSTRSVGSRALKEHFRGMYRFFLTHYRLQPYERAILFGELFCGFWTYLLYQCVRRLRWHRKERMRVAQPSETDGGNGP